MSSNGWGGGGNHVCNFDSEISLQTSAWKNRKEIQGITTCLAQQVGEGLNV
jgi:hypothetical protein